MSKFKIIIRDIEGNEVERDINLYKIYIESDEHSLARNVFEMYEILTDYKIKF